jgi:gluconate 2-dehydrogenase gamma chain
MLGFSSMNIDRRLFLFALSAPLHAAAPLRSLGADESKVIEALCAQIIPADDWPGAKEAGVLYYIDKQLAGPLKRFAADYTSGIAALNHAAGKPFNELSSGEQKDLMLRIEAGHDVELNHFLQLVIDHTMQGFYGSPEHGGNKGETSWKMLQITDVMEGHKH